MKIYAFDVDGTLVTTTHEIQESTLQVLKDIEARGDKWLLVTGRNYELVKPLLKTYQLKCDCITNSGHMFVDKDGNEGSKISMSDKVLREVLEILLKYDFHISVHGDTTKFIFADPEEYFEQHMRISREKHGDLLEKMQHSPFFNKELFINNTTQVETIDDLLKSSAKVLKIDARNHDHEQLHQGIKELNKIDDIVVHSSYEAFLEISEKTSNKAIMLQKYVEGHGVNFDDVYVFGDSMNDIELFEEFNNSIAMGNANDDVKALAKWITDTHNDEGIAKAFKKYKL